MAGQRPAGHGFGDAIAELAVNPVILRGDLYFAVAGNGVPRGADKTVSAEFLTTSVTSPGFSDLVTERHPGALRDATLAINPDIAYVETEHRGWLRVTFTPEACIGEWHMLDGVRGDSYSSVDKRLGVRAGRNHGGLDAV